jgi:hypothetical protein
METEFKSKGAQFKTAEGRGLFLHPVVDLRVLSDPSSQIQ